MSREAHIHAYKRSFRERSLNFDGSNDYIDLTALAALSFERTDSFTVEMWIYPEDLVASQILIGNVLNGPTFQGWEVLTTGDKLQFTLTNNEATNQIRVVNTNIVLTLETWNHIAFTYDGSSSASGVTCYINGFEEPLSTTVDNLSASIDSGEPIEIGIRQEAGFPYEGSIADLRIWGDVRTRQEISYHNNLQWIDPITNTIDSSIDTTDLLLYLPLNETSGTTAEDYSGNDYDGTLTNFSGDFWSTAESGLPIIEKEYKAHTSRFIFSGIQENLQTGVSSMEFTLPNITDIDSKEVFRDLEGVELQLDYISNLTASKTLYSGLNRITNTKGKNVKQVDTVSLSAIEFLTNGYTPKGTDGTYNFSYSSESIEQCFKNLIDTYNAQNPPIPLNYTSESLETTGKNITINFYNPLNYLVAFKAVWRHTDIDWIWFIDASNTVHLKQISTTPDFIFTYGRDFFRARIDKDATKITNRMRITNGSVHRAYKDQDSINSYGQKIQIIKDERLVSAGMDELADNVIDSTKNPNEQITARVTDISAGGSYDISSGLLGKVFSVVNTDETITDKVITSVTYYPEKGFANIIASDKESYIFRELNDLRESQFQVNFGSSAPDVYTEV